MTDEQAKQNIAANLQRLIKSRGWSQRKLADAVQSTTMRVSDTVRGEHVPSAAFLARLAVALDVTPNDILSFPRKSRQTA